MNDNNNKDFEYTIVLDGSYNGPDLKEEIRAAERARQEEAANKKAEAEAGSNKDIIDRLYYEYEKMCLGEPTVLDKDDVYPHSYQWRMGDRYDPLKKEVLEEALAGGIRISDTEAYQRYIEEMKTRKFTPVSWD